MSLGDKRKYGRPVTMVLFTHSVPRGSCHQCKKWFIQNLKRNRLEIQVLDQQLDPNGSLDHRDLDDPGTRSLGATNLETCISWMLKVSRLSAQARHDSDVFLITPPQKTMCRVSPALL